MLQFKNLYLAQTLNHRKKKVNITKLKTMFLALSFVMGQFNLTLKL